MTKIVFMGTPQFAVPVLEGLIENNYEILAVVTQPDRKVGRKKVLTPTPVKEAALAHQLKVLQPEKISGSEEMEWIIQMQPDLIITAAFGQFLPQALLDAPKYGALNVHASLLPKYRGGAPIHYAVMNGDDKTGVTIMEMVKKMDAGDIIRQAAIPITKQDNTGTMFEKLSLLGKELLLDVLPDYLAGKITPIPQNEEEASYSPNITREQERISLQLPAERVDALIRGMYPFPIAHIIHQGKRMKLLKATALEDKTTQQPGTVVAKHKDAIDVACGDQSILRIYELQPAGKSKMKVSDYLNGMGRNLQIGDSFDDEDEEKDKA